jgi:hypothetical protein
VGRWRLRRTRHLWILNGVLVLLYRSAEEFRRAEGDESSTGLIVHRMWRGNNVALQNLDPDQRTTRSVRRVSGLLETLALYRK